MRLSTSAGGLRRCRSTSCAYGVNLVATQLRLYARLSLMCMKVRDNVAMATKQAIDGVEAERLIVLDRADVFLPVPPSRDTFALAYVNQA